LIICWICWENNCHRFHLVNKIECGQIRPLSLFLFLLLLLLLIVFLLSFVSVHLIYIFFRPLDILTDMVMVLLMFYLNCSKFSFQKVAVALEYLIQMFFLFLCYHFLPIKIIRIFHLVEFQVESIRGILDQNEHILYLLEDILRSF
jgi:hypothetical protein